MRSSIRLLPLAACLIAAAPWNDDQDPGLPGARSGDATTYAAAGFHALALAGGSSANVRVGPTWSVRAVGPQAAIDQLRVRVRDDELVIDTRIPYRHGEDTLRRQVRFDITVPTLTGVAVGGSGNIAVDRVTGAALKLAIGGSGDVRIGQLAVDSTNVSIGGAGSIAATGTTRLLTVNIGGSGSFNAPGLGAREARISTAGNGNVQARVNGTARISTVGSGRIDLGPDARCTVSRMGSSTIRCGG